MKALSIRTAALATALMASTAAAAQAPIEVEGALPQAEVSYADLDLGNPSGVGALELRVRAAASRLCFGYRGGDIEERQGRRACFTTALASARGQMEQAVADSGRPQLAGRRTITVAAR